MNIKDKKHLEDLKKIVSEIAFKVFENDENLHNDLDATPNTENEPQPEPEIEKTDADVDNSTPIDNGLDNTKEFGNLSEILKKLSSSIDPHKLEEINGEITKTLSTGKVNRNYTFEKMVTAGVDKNLFDYFVTVLATLYKEGADSIEKENIRKAMFLVFPVYNTTSVEHGSGDIRSSPFTNLIANKAGIGYSIRNSKTIDASYYIDILASAIYEGIEYALDNYDPKRGGTFTSVVIFKSASNAKDELGSKLHKKSFASAGHKSSLDEPLGTTGEDRDETEADRITGKENEVSSSEKEAIKGFANALKSFVQEKLGQKEALKNYLEFFNLFTQGHNLSEIADIMGKEPGNIRVIKKRMEDFITKFVESGELQDYIAEETGIKVDFPNNKFSLSVQGTNKGEGEVEPVEYFNVTGYDSNNEPIGEWIKMTPDTHDSDTTWFDKYGDFVFDKEGDKEEDALEQSNEPNAEQENQIAESLMRMVKNRLFKK